MKTSKISQAAILLWVISIAVFAWFFINGSTTAGSDGRTAIVLQPTERDLVLSEMRGLLVATQGIVEAASKGDIAQAGKAAGKAGMAAAADVNPALMAKLPLKFKQLGMSVHRDMDEIARVAGEGEISADEILKMTANTLNKCIACHATWQLKAAD